MPRNPNPVASATKAIIRASPPLKTIAKASASLHKAANSNHHFFRALLSLVATRNLIKSIIFFRPVNRKTLKPGSPLWKVFLKAIWMAIWPAIGQSLAKRFIKQPIAEAMEVKACEEDVSVNKEEKDIVATVNPESVAGGLATYAAELRAIEARAAKSARFLEEQELAFQREFAQVEELAVTEASTRAFERTTVLRAPEIHSMDMAQTDEAKELLRQIEVAQAQKP